MRNFCQIKIIYLIGVNLHNHAFHKIWPLSLPCRCQVLPSCHLPPLITPPLVTPPLTSLLQTQTAPSHLTSVHVPCNYTHTFGQHHHKSKNLWFFLNNLIIHFMYVLCVCQHTPLWTSSQWILSILWVLEPGHFQPCDIEVKIDRKLVCMIVSPMSTVPFDYTRTHHTHTLGMYASYAIVPKGRLLRCTQHSFLLRSGKLNKIFFFCWTDSQLEDREALTCWDR